MRIKFFLPLLLIGCGTSPGPRIASDARVYAAVLDSIIRVGDTIVLLDSTRAPFAKSRGQALPRIRLSARTLIVAPWDSIVMQRPPQRDYWEQFHSRFPNAYGWCSLSEVSYTLLGKGASLYLACSCGDLCGWDQIITLANEHGVWRVTKVETMLVS